MECLIAPNCFLFTLFIYKETLIPVKQLFTEAINEM